MPLHIPQEPHVPIQLFNRLEKRAIETLRPVYMIVFASPIAPTQFEGIEESGPQDELVGQSWCSDCRKAAPLLAERFPDSGRDALLVYAGDKPEWRSEENLWRGDPFFIRALPTIVKIIPKTKKFLASMEGSHSKYNSKSKAVKRPNQEGLDRVEEDKVKEEEGLKQKSGSRAWRTQPTFMDELVEGDVYDVEKLDAFLAKDNYEAGDGNDQTSKATQQPQLDKNNKDEKDDKNDSNHKNTTSEPQHTEDYTDDKNDADGEEEGGKKQGLISKARKALKRLSQ